MNMTTVKCYPLNKYRRLVTINNINFLKIKEKMQK